MSAPVLLRAFVRGLEIDAQGHIGGVVHLTVRANEQHKSLFGRLRQHVANALFRAGDICYPGHDHNAVRVVEVHVGGASLDHSQTNLTQEHVREVWPLHGALDEAYYNPFLVHEGVKCHQDGRPASDEFISLCRQRGTDDSQRISPVALSTLSATLTGLEVRLWPADGGQS